ncbi:MAG: hypothetical protein GY714_14115 [Desulfobacterales bacterium]|nr:hypothetical protein [Desulfobacterales bacterium]
MLNFEPHGKGAFYIGKKMVFRGQFREGVPVMWDMARKITDDQKLVEQCMRWNVYRSRNCFRTLCERAKCQVKNPDDARNKLKKALDFFEKIKETKLLDDKKIDMERYNTTKESFDNFFHIICTNNKLFIERMNTNRFWKCMGFRKAILRLKVEFHCL